MNGNPTPRQMAKDLLQGTAPPRPLFLPMVFSVGARIENVPLPAYLSNPTKIANAQRQIRGPLRSDGVLCYCDPYLEAEALGAAVRWENDNLSRSLRWPGDPERGEMPEDIRMPNEALKSGRVAFAIDATRRLSAMVRDGSLLVASVTGPFTLAARILQLHAQGGASFHDKFPVEAMQLSAELITKLSAAFAETGANLIFIHEEIVPPLPAEACESWAFLLAPIVNVIQFYEALPALLVTDEHFLSHSAQVFFQHPWSCPICSALDADTVSPYGSISPGAGIPLGFALPLKMFQPEGPGGKNIREALESAVSHHHPAILTTAGDVPPVTDMKHLLKMLEAVPRAY